MFSFNVSNLFFLDKIFDVRFCVLRLLIFVEGNFLLEIYGIIYRVKIYGKCNVEILILVLF